MLPGLSNCSSLPFLLQFTPPPAPHPEVGGSAPSVLSGLIIIQDAEALVKWEMFLEKEGDGELILFH